MFQDVFEIFESTFEVYIEDQLVNRQTLQAPKEILMMQFVQLYEQVKTDKRPMKIKIVRPEVIWDNFESRQRVLNNEVSFSNSAMIEFEEKYKK